MYEEKKVQDFGWRIRSLRTSQGISQSELAKRCGLDQSYISRLERGLVEGTTSQLSAIAKALGTTVSEILGEAVREPTEEYAKQRETDPRAAILADYQAPEGLRDLAQDKALIEALKITPEEWRALASLKPPIPLTKEGYVQVLFALRSGGRKDRVSVT